MSTSIDERVVALQFENKDFESGAKESLSTIDKLKNALNFTGAGKSLEEIDNTAQKINFNPMSDGLEAVRVKFSLLDQMAMTVLNNIVNRVTNTGINLVKSLSVDQITSGWGKFADKTTAVQTIMAATSKEIGTTYKDTNDQMEKVNEQLQKLNWFTDETSYKFVDMTSNIGKFTSNGVKLETAVSAMQGVATWAARSGANANEASRAMYNLSQAMGTGALMTKDWMSIENANMATAEFKETCIETAVELGVLKKGIDGVATSTKGTAITVETFRESLSEKWITGDVLTATLQKYGDFTTKLKTSQETVQDIIDKNNISYEVTTGKMMDWIDQTAEGTMKWNKLQNDLGLDGKTEEFENLKTAISELADGQYDLGRKSFRAAQETKTFAESIDYVKEAVSSTWMNTFEIIFGDYKEAKSLWTDLSDTLYELFVVSGETRNEILEKWADKGGRARFVEALTAQADAIVQVVSALRKGFGSVFGDTDHIAHVITVLTAKFRNFSESLDKYVIKHLDEIQRTAAGVGAVFHILGQFVTAVAHGFIELFKAIVPVGDGFLNLTANFGDNLVALDEWISKSGIFTKAVDKIVEVIKLVGSVAKSIFDGTIGLVLEGLVSKFKTSEDGTVTFLDKLKELFTTTENGVTVFKRIGDKLHDIFGGIKEFIQPLVDGVKQLFDTLAKRMENLSMSNVWTGLKMLFAGVGAKKILDILGNLKKGSNTLKEGLEGVFESINGLFKGFKPEDNNKLMDFAKAVALLSASLVGLSLIDSSNLSSSIAAMGSLLAMMTGAMATIEAINKKFSGPIQKQGLFDKIGSMFGLGGGSSGDKAFTNLIKIAGSVLVLTIALKQIADLKPEQLQQAMKAITELLIDLVGVIGVLGLFHKFNIDKNNATVGKLTSIAFAITLLCVPIELLGRMNAAQLEQGLSGMERVLFEMVGVLAAMTVISKWNHNEAIKGVGQLVIFSMALVNLCIPIELLGRMNPEQFAQGLVGVSVLMGEMLAVLGIMQYIDGNSVSAALTNTVLMITFTNQIIKLIIPVELLGRMELGQLVKGITAVGAIMAELVASVAVLNNIPSGSITSAISNLVTLTALTTSLTVLSGVIAGLGLMDDGKIKQGLTGFTILLGELATSLALFSKLNPAGMISAAGAMVIMAGALALLVPQVVLLGSLDLWTIVKGLGAMAASIGIIAGLSALITPLTPAIVGAAGALAAFGAALGVVGLAVAAIGLGVAGLAFGLKEIVELLKTTGVDIVEVFKVAALAVVELLPAIITGFDETLQAILKLLINNAPLLGTAFVTLVSEALKALAQSVPELVVTVIDIILQVLGVLAQNMKEITVKLGEIIVETIKGLSVALPDIIVAVMDFMGQVFNALIVAFKSFDFSDFMKGVAVIGAVSAMMVALNLITPLVPGALAGLLGVSKVIAAITGVIAAFGAINLIPGVSTLMESGGNLLESIGVAIGKFVGGLIGGLGEGIADSFPKIGQDLSDFAKNATGFVEFASGVDESLMTGVGILVKAMLDLTSATFKDSITSFFTGGSDIVSFSEKLIPFGENLAAFGEAIKDVDADKMSGAGIAMQGLAAMYEAMPKDGGLFSMFSGSGDISEFGDQLVTFGQKLTEFSDAVVDVKYDSIENAVTSATKLNEFANSIGNSGGLISVFAGDNTLSGFGDNLVDFGTALVTFGDSVSELDHDQIALAVIDAERIVGISDVTDNSNNLVTIGSNIASFGSSFAEFAEFMLKYQGFNFSTFTTTFATFINQQSGIVDIFTAVKDTINNAVNTIKNSSPRFYNSGATMIQQLINGVNSKKSAFETTMTTMLDGIIKIVESYKPTAALTARTILDNTITEINPYVDEFKTVGSNFAQGIADGISNNSQVIWDAAYNAALKAKEAAMLALDEHSPSKEGDKIGVNWNRGQAGGIKRSAHLVYDSSYNSAMEAIYATQDVMGEIDNYIDSNIDLDPKITPVLDLSQIQNGTNMLDSLIGRYGPAVGFTGNVSFNDPQVGVMGYINSALDKAIDTLTDKIEQLQNNTQYTFEAPITLNGRQIAKASASYTKEELDKLDRIKSRKNGDL